MTTTHPEHDELLALVDAELPAHQASEVTSHLARCTTCSEVVTALRSTASAFANVLHAMDSTEPEYWKPPEVDGTHVGGRVSAEVGAEPFAQLSAKPFAQPSAEPFAQPSGAVLPLQPRAQHAESSATRSHRRIWPRGSDALRWAAAVLLVTGAAASAAIVANRVLSDGEGLALPVVEPTAVEQRVAAVMVTPVDGALRIAVTGAGAESRLVVMFEDRADARVAVEGAGAPRFTAVRGRVDVDLAGASVTVRVTLPRTLRDVNVTADGRTVATVQNESVVPAEAADGGVPITMSNTE